MGGDGGPFGSRGQPGSSTIRAFLRREYLSRDHPLVSGTRSAVPLFRETRRKVGIGARTLQHCGQAVFYYWSGPVVPAKALSQGLVNAATAGAAREQGLTRCDRRRPRRVKEKGKKGPLRARNGEGAGAYKNLEASTDRWSRARETAKVRSAEQEIRKLCARKDRPSSVRSGASRSRPKGSAVCNGLAEKSSEAALPSPAQNGDGG